MKILTLSPSKVELWRKYEHGGYPYASFDALVESIKGIRTFSEKANFGTAIHSMIEKGAAYYSDGNHYRISDEKGQNIVFVNQTFADFTDALRSALEGAKYEVWLEPIFQSACGSVKIRMRLDAVLDSVVHDFKTTDISAQDKAGKLSEYAESCQWRFYLWATGFHIAQYHLIKYASENIGALPDDVGDDMPVPAYKLGYQSAEFYAYPEMESDLNALICGLVGFCEQNGLNDYIYK